MDALAELLPDLPVDALLVRVLELHGFGSRHAGEAAAFAEDATHLGGRLLAGLADETISDAITAGTRIGTITARVSDPAAADAGMACGGQAMLLVHPVAMIPPAARAALTSGTPTVLATNVETGATRAVVDGADAVGSTDKHGADGAADDAVDRHAARLLRAGRPTLEVHDGIAIEAHLPPTTVRIVGHAGVGDALVAQAALLGWRSETVDGPEPATAAGRSQASHDALVVLSHDPDIDTPALAAALTHSRGYVGALGSRGTQSARRDRLRTMGFDDEQLATIHGPVGLDLGSRTPAETAVAIVAEIIAHRAGRDARSLATGDGPING